MNINPDNSAPPMIGEILFYEHSNCIKHEPEDINFFNEGILENSLTFCENTHQQLNAVKSKTPNKYKLAKEDLIGEAIDDKLPKQELVVEAVDFDYEFTEYPKVFQENSCISVLAKLPDENVDVNSPNKRFQNDKDFYVQQANSESVLLYKCNMCPNPHFFKRNYLENPHKVQQQSSPPVQKRTLKYKCEVPGCEYKTDHRRRFNNHAVVHSDKKYECDACDFITKSEKYLENHKDTIHHQNAQRSFCKQCTYNSTSKERFRQHELSHRDPSLRETHKCNFEGCLFKTVSKKSLYRHFIRHKDRSKMSSLKCTSCSYETIYKDDFRKHLRRHHKPIGEKMYCFNCSFKTVSKMSLKNHMLTHTKVEALEMFNCSQCCYTSKRKGNLLQHMVKHSSDIEMFKCFNCAFETKRKHTLRNHMDTHKKF